MRQRNSHLDVKRFIAGSRNQTVEQIQRLTDVTQNLSDHKIALENVLHVAPNAFANGYNIYNPVTGDYGGAFTLPNFSNPAGFVCGTIGALENAVAIVKGASGTWFGTDAVGLPRRAA